MALEELVFDENKEKVCKVDFFHYLKKVQSLNIPTDKAFEKITGKTYSEIEKYVGDAQNAKRYYTEGKNAIERSEKRLLESLISGLNEFKKGSLKNLMHAALKSLKDEPADYKVCKIMWRNETEFFSQIEMLIGFYFDLKTDGSKIELVKRKDFDFLNTQK